MWTKRTHYLDTMNQIREYLPNIEYFHDYLIGNFSYQQSTQRLEFTIEEDYLPIDKSNAPALIWDIVCEGIHNLEISDMDGLSRWWLYEVTFSGQRLELQLVNGYIAFEFESIKMGIPSEY